MDTNKVEKFISEPITKKSQFFLTMFSIPAYVCFWFPFLSFLVIGIITLEGNKPAKFSSLENPEKHLCYQKDFVDCTIRVVEMSCQALSHLTGKDICWVSRWKSFNLIVRHWTPPVMEEEQVSCKPGSTDKRCA